MRRSVGLFVMFLLAAGHAFAGEPRFQRIGPERGLQAGDITALYQDRIGFLWIGTREGLLLYDGYGITAFNHDVDDPGSLADNQIRALLEDREGRLWIGTYSAGLDLFDRAARRFVHHRHDSSDPASIRHNAVFALLQDHAGGIWVGTQHGLARFDPKSERFEASGVQGWVLDLLEDRDGNLWVTTFGDGIFRRRAGSADFQPVKVVGAPTSFHPERARCVEQDRDGTIWVGVMGGLVRIDSGGAEPRAVELPVGPGGPTGVPTASDLAVAPDGTVWVATPGAGLIAMNPRTVSGPRYVHRVGIDTSLSSDNIQRLHLGRDGTLWIGTGDGTLNQLRGGADFLSILGASETDEDLGFGAAVAEDVSGRLWLGSFNSGIEIVDSSGAKVLDRSPPTSQSGEDAIASMAPASGGGAWVGTTIGLARFSSKAKPERWWRPDPDDPVSLGRGYVDAVLEARDGTVWVGTEGSGLYRMRRDRSGFEAFRHDPQDPSSLADDSVRSLTEDREGTLWIGTRSGGVNLLSPDSGRPRRYVLRPWDLDALAGQNVTSIVEDRAGRIWVGTAGGGVYRIDRSGPEVRVTRLDRRAGLVDDNVSSLLEDDDGSIWIATRRGLARLDPVRGVFATWGLDDGLPSLAFKAGSAWRGRSSLYFATPKGLVAIRRGTPFPSLTPSPVALTSLRTLDGPILAARDVAEVERISIRYGDVLFVDYAVLDFRGPDRHRFAYRLGETTSAWVDMGNRRSLTLTNLDPGKHVLGIRGRNANGVWAETAHPLLIDVVPPFWMAWWFRTAAVLSLAVLALGWHRVRTVRLERRNAELLRLKDERESAYDRLRDLTRRLEDAKEEERRRIARELHDEMGQALSAVKINLKALGRASTGAAREERVNDALSLVDGMIGHVREISLDLRPPLLDELGLVAALRGYAEAQAMRSGVEITVQATDGGAGVSPDIAITAFRIVQEAIHNTLRHAAARHVTVSVRHGDDRLELNIRDDGKGFDVDEALGRAAKGGHLGLLGMRERVEALGGSFAVESAPGGGTVIRAAVPLVAAEVRP